MSNIKPSINLIYDMMLEQHKLLSNWCDSIDIKVTALFGFNTVIIGVIASVNKSHLSFNLAIISFAIAVIAFLVSSVYAIKGFQTKGFSFGFDPSILLEDYASMQPEDAKYFLAKSDGKHWKQNLDAINDKANSLRIAIYWSGLEVAALVFWIILS